ncbi:MAG: FAD-dependent oxidoreductase, partial [Planctomycetota bacterium]
MVTEAVSGAGGARGRDFEAVVIGAGPAGSVAAFVLARRGMRVLLVERRAFPRDKVCGGCLAPAGAATLEALGMIRGGFSFDGDRVFGPSLSRVRVLGGGDVLGHRGFTLPLRPYVAVERRGFDAALVAAAV